MATCWVSAPKSTAISARSETPPGADANNAVTGVRFEAPEIINANITLKPSSMDTIISADFERRRKDAKSARVKLSPMITPENA
jgi:hypothetical protein